MVLVGDFTGIEGIAAGNLIRLNTDGSYDAGFTLNVLGRVSTIALQSASDNILIGGNISNVAGIERGRLARLQEDVPLCLPISANNGNIAVVCL